MKSRSSHILALLLYLLPFTFSAPIITIANTGVQQIFTIYEWDTETGAIGKIYSLANSCPSWTFTFLEFTGARDPVSGLIVFEAFSPTVFRDTHYLFDFNTGNCTRWNPPIDNWSEYSSWYKLIRYNPISGCIDMCGQFIPHYSNYTTNNYVCYEIFLPTNSIKTSYTVTLPENANPIGPEESGNLGGWVQDNDKIGFYTQYTQQNGNNYTTRLGFAQLAPTISWTDIGPSFVPILALLNSNKTQLVIGGICSPNNMALFGATNLRIFDVSSGSETNYYFDKSGNPSDGAGCTGTYEHPLVNSQIWIGKDTFISASTLIPGDYVYSQFSLDPISVKIVTNSLGKEFVPLILN